MVTRTQDELLAVMHTRCEPEPNTGCWLWTASVTGAGYGKQTVRGRLDGAHRVMYELLRGPIGEGLQLDHLCRVPCCVNPDHLEPVTQRENIKRGFRARGTADGHCSKGHLKTYEWRGERYCVECRHERNASPEALAKAKARYYANREAILARQRMRRSVSNSDRERSA